MFKTVFYPLGDRKCIWSIAKASVFPKTPYKWKFVFSCSSFLTIMVNINSNREQCLYFLLLKNILPSVAEIYAVTKYLFLIITITKLCPLISIFYQMKEKLPRKVKSWPDYSGLSVHAIHISPIVASLHTLCRHGK